MNTKTIVLTVVGLTLALGAGCASARGTSVSDSSRYTLEDTEAFVILDRATESLISCTGLREQRLANGRLEVVANIKNREDRRIQVQVNCVFLDANGYPTGDETPYRTFTLGGNATEAVKFSAANTLGKKYTIRVRVVR